MNSHKPGDNKRVRSLAAWFYFIFVMDVCPVSLFAASAPLKATFTYGGLNERSGVLFVARDAGIFQKHGLDATIVNVRNAQVGMSALAGGETSSTWGPLRGPLSEPWPAVSI